MLQLPSKGVLHAGFTVEGDEHITTVVFANRAALLQYLNNLPAEVYMLLLYVCIAMLSIS